MVASAIGAAVGIGTSLLGASKNKKAINKATAAETAANAASLALQKDIYGQNKGALSPAIGRGDVAGNTINALLGLGAPQQPVTAGALSTYSTPQYFDIGGQQIPMNTDWSGNAQSPYQLSYGGQPAMGAAPAPTANPQQSALDAYNIFKQSTGYQDRLQEGYRGVNSAYAGRGLLQSGAAQKSLLRYGQQQASGEFGNFMGYLGNQQGVGLSAASALAGVGQSYANNVTSLNSANASAIGQGAVAKANNSNQMYSGIAGALGNVFGSSYG